MTDKPSQERRAFLSKLTSVVGGTATMAVVAPIVNASPVIESEKPQVESPLSKGYQRTQHVDKYYQLADF
jgi:hypothetical protein